jgi:hypothetical protein
MQLIPAGRAYVHTCMLGVAATSSALAVPVRLELRDDARAVPVRQQHAEKGHDGKNFLVKFTEETPPKEVAAGAYAQCTEIKRGQHSLRGQGQSCHGRATKYLKTPKRVP